MWLDCTCLLAHTPREHEVLGRLVQLSPKPQPGAVRADTPLQLLDRRPLEPRVPQFVAPPPAVGQSKLTPPALVDAAGVLIVQRLVLALQFRLNESPRQRHPLRYPAELYCHVASVRCSPQPHQVLQQHLVPPVHVFELRAAADIVRPPKSPNQAASTYWGYRLPARVSERRTPH